MAEKRANGTAVAAYGNGHGSASTEGDARAGTEIIDLNTATKDELRQLRGVGPALAERVVQYRATKGDFASPEALMQVPGISQAIFDSNKHRLIARSGGAVAGPALVPPASLPELPNPMQAQHESASAGENGESIADAAQMETATEEAQLQAATSGAEEVGKTTAVQVEAAADASRVQPTPTPAVGVDKASGSEPPMASATDVLGAQPVSAQVSEKGTPIDQPPLPKAQPAQSVFAPPVAGLPPVAQEAAARPAGRDWTGLMAMTVLGAMLGAILALLAVAGLNGGALMLNERAEVVALRADLDAAKTRADALENEATALRARMEALEGLSNRVVEVESGLAAADAALDTLADETAALNDRTTAVEGEVAVVRTAVDRFSEFLVGLRTLLDAALPGEAGAATATPGASATLPNPTRTPAATRPPAATAAP